MADASGGARGRGFGVADWCGWVMVGTAALAPLLIWIGPLAFAPVVGLAGLLCLPALRIEARDWPLAAVLALLLAWAGASTLWSPYTPDDLEGNTALKLALQLPLYWAAWCGARRAEAGLRRRALAVFAWVTAAVGLLMLIEALSGGAVYQAMRSAIGDPIRPDLARKNLAQGSFALALLWPVAAAAAARGGAPGWLAVPMAAGAVMLAWRFLSDAPVMAVALSAAVALAAWLWPRGAPKALALGAALYVLLMPVATLPILGLAEAAPPSWAQRLGYWGHAITLITDHPFRGWGLDASRAFSPGIQLHPHNGALQVWLELGLPGAVLAALAWLIVLRRLARDRSDWGAATAVGAAATYLFFGAVSFGVWQEWWLALGALAASVAAMAEAEPVRRTAAKRSTAAASSG
jgi:O-antigen ligase